MLKASKISAWAVAAASAVAIAACSGHSAEYNGFTPLPPEGWAYGDTIFFTPEMRDSVATGRFKLYLTHNPSYLFSNAWVEISYPTPNGRMADTLELHIADDFGHWLGTGPGTSYQVEAATNRRLRLTSGTPVAVRHIMRLDTVRNIESIGLRFE